VAIEPAAIAQASAGLQDSGWPWHAVKGARTDAVEPHTPAAVGHCIAAGGAVAAVAVEVVAGMPAADIVAVDTVAAAAAAAELAGGTVLLFVRSALKELRHKT
jgi:hypothetical protein